MKASSDSTRRSHGRPIDGIAASRSTPLPIAEQTGGPSSRRDAYATITARIVDALERGTVPWREPWHVRGHRNAYSARPYRGINLLMLGMTALEQGFDDARWLTYRQAQQHHGQVRRAQHGTHVVLWKWIERNADQDVGTENVPAAAEFPLLRLFTVFNVAQCEGLMLGSNDADAPGMGHASADAVIGGYADGPAIRHDADCAYYVAARDEVHTPPRQAFATADAYYATLFHELGHSTGHPSRLNRPGLAAGTGPFGSEAYSREELVAEFAAAFLCHEAAVDPSCLEQSAAYIHTWLQALRDDRRLLVTAAAQAQRAVDYILGGKPQAAP